MKVEQFHPFVLPEVLGCPDLVMNQAIVSAAQDFCRESMAWSEFLDPIQLINSEPSYDLDIPTGAYVVSVRDAWLGARRLQPATMLQLQTLMPDWQTSRGNEPVYYNAATDRGQITVYPTPSNATGQKVLVRVAMAPTFDATTLPDFLGQRFMQVIASGAKARLMLVPGQTWSNPNLGAYHRTQFDAGVADARAAEIHERIQGSVAVKPRAFGF